MKRMKKFAIRAISLIMIISVALCTASCADKKSYAVYYENEKGKVPAYLTEGQYSYFVSQQKSKYLLDLSIGLYYSEGIVAEDTPELWSRKATDGKTYAEVYDASILSDAKKIVAANYLLSTFADKDGKAYKLPEAYVESVDSMVRENAKNTFGSVRAFEDYLYNFGISLDEYIDLYIKTANIDLVKEALFNDETGTYRFSEEDKKTYYDANYYSVKQILINNVAGENIEGKKTQLSNAERKKRTEVAESVAKDVSSGISFTDIGKKYADKNYVAVYLDIIRIDLDAQAQDQKVADAIKSIGPGEVTSVQTDNGLYIFERVNNDQNGYKEEDVNTAIVSVLADKLMPKMLEACFDSIVVNEKITGNCGIADALVDKSGMN